MKTRGAAQRIGQYLLPSLVLGYAVSASAEQIPDSTASRVEPALAQSPIPEAQSLGACVAAHTAARAALEQQALILARSELRQCAAIGCPIAVRAECGEWLNEAERQVPTLVLSARTERGDAAAARVLIDGQVLAEHLDGQPIEAQPGPHVLTFELPDGRRQELRIVVGIGEKDRLVRADFSAASSSAAASSNHTASAPTAASSEIASVGVLNHRQRDLGLILGLAALGGAVAAGTFAYVGLDRRRAAEDSCAPLCTDYEVSRVRRWFILADVAGVAAAVTGGVGLYLVVSGDQKRGQSSAAFTWRGEF